MDIALIQHAFQQFSVEIAKGYDAPAGFHVAHSGRFALVFSNSPSAMFFTHLSDLFDFIVDFHRDCKQYSITAALLYNKTRSSKSH